MSNLWDSIKSIKIVLSTSSQSYIDELILGCKQIGINPNEVLVINYLDDPKKIGLLDNSKSNCILLTKKEFSFFGGFKSAQIEKTVTSRKDLIFLISEINVKIVKKITFKQSAFISSLNENRSFAQLNLSTDRKNGVDQMELLKNTLSKIVLK